MKKRVMVDSDDEEEVFWKECPKRAKPNEKSRLEDEYACPITHELFVDPVMAEDGRVYEREAISRMFHVCKEQGEETTIRSPMTNEAMGTKLYPAHQVRSTLAILIGESMLNIHGDRVIAWKVAMENIEKNRRMVATLKSLAEEGSPQAMYDLARAFRKGEYGLTKNDESGYSWYERARILGHVSAMCVAGQCHITGRGVGTVNVTLGVAMVYASAWRGSEHGCSEIAHWHSNGMHNLPKNLVEARFYYMKMQQAEIKDSLPVCRERARIFLDSVTSVDTFLSSLNA